MNTQRDVFICHASEDKDDVARPLYEAFSKSNIACWFDEGELKWGDDVVGKINQGLKACRYLVVVLSKAAIQKEWPVAELLAKLSEQISSGEVRVCPLFVGSDADVAEIREEFPLLAGKFSLRWELGVDTITQAMLARLSRDETRIPDISKRKHQTAVLKKFGAVILAAGRGSRMEMGQSKHLIRISYREQTQSMLFYVLDIFTRRSIPTLVLVGYDGESVRSAISAQYGPAGPKCLAVSQPDGSDLEPNTGGTLKKFADRILNCLPTAENLLLCVGDQPYMHRDTITDFILDYAEKGRVAGLLAADSRNTTLERSTSTRIAPVGDKISFITPSTESQIESYSTLLDVGVLILRREAFEAAAKDIGPNEVFSKLLYHLPERADRKIFLKVDRDPHQFRNVNEPRDVVDGPWTEDSIIQVTPSVDRDPEARRSELLLKWLAWNVDKERKGEFPLLEYSDVLHLVGELDTTLLCPGTPACVADCTYRDRHQGLFLDCGLGEYALRRAKEIGYSGVLFSGGGENLEPAAYANFVSLLRYAKKEQSLVTNLATNGLHLDRDEALDLARLLDTVRFSVPAMKGPYCHGGVIAPNIVRFRRAVSFLKRLHADYVPAKVYANILMSPEMDVDELEALVRVFSQIGVDAIRLKPRHERSGGSLVLQPERYKGLVQRVDELKRDTEFRLPHVTIGKLAGLLDEDETNGIEAKACWYRDFNPLILGCDGHIYACCEMKYDNNGFDCGKVSPAEDNLPSLLAARSNPQPIVPGKCFRGCKGYLINKDLQFLLTSYADHGADLFQHRENAEVRDRVLQNIPRDVLTN